MRRFTQLYFELDETTRTNEKVAALERYFREVSPRDAAWALFFLTGQKLKRAVSSPHLRQWTTEAAGLPMWLFEECYDSVGDLAETAALLFPDDGAGARPEAGGTGRVPGDMPSDARSAVSTPSSAFPLHRLVEEHLVPLPALPESERRALLVDTWRALNERERYVWNKLITGEFRVGVARTLVVRALAGVAGVEPAVMAHRLMGEWRPTEQEFLRVMSDEEGAGDPKRPYPFYLAHPLELEVRESRKTPEGASVSRSATADVARALEKTLGGVELWQAEWKWDGIRAQLIRRGDDVALWSRGEDLITDRFPEVSGVGRLLPDGTVMDGEILAWQDERPLRFGDLQKRITVKSVSKKLLSEVPAAFMAYDLLEEGGRDMRGEPLSVRRARLEEVVAELYQPEEPEAGPAVGDLKTVNRSLPIRLSPVLRPETWSDLVLMRSESRENDAEGLMLKRLAGPYQVGRVRGDWWKWKIEPYTIDAVLIYAQPGHGRRASLYTDYTFGLWHNDQLVPVAKAYSGLTDAEIKDVDAWVRRNTIERYGPVRTVRPELVFEIAFEGIQPSTRHKSGIAVRFPRIQRWRQDKTIEQADTLEMLKELAGL